MIRVFATETLWYPIFIIDDNPRDDDTEIEVYEDFIEEYNAAMKIFWDMQQKVQALYKETRETSEIAQRAGE